jgi:hypothetical protein
MLLLANKPSNPRKIRVIAKKSQVNFDVCNTSIPLLSNELGLEPEILNGGYVPYKY